MSIITVEILKPLIVDAGGFAAASVFIAFLLRKPKKRKSKNSRLSKTTTTLTSKPTFKSAKESTPEFKPTPTQVKKPEHNEWSIDLLMSLEWKRYEEICKEILAIKGNGRFNISTTKIGADGGIDLKITDEKGNVTALGQCKAYNSQIGVAFIREFYGVIASEKVEHGYFFTTSKFSNDAIEFANKNKITLINGQNLLKTIQSFKPEQQKHLFTIATDGDYTTPTCANCDVKMVKKSSERGEFWGCVNYPRCKNTLNIRK